MKLLLQPQTSALLDCFRAVPGQGSITFPRLTETGKLVDPPFELSSQTVTEFRALMGGLCLEAKNIPDLKDVVGMEGVIDLIGKDEGGIPVSDLGSAQPWELMHSSITGTNIRRYHFSRGSKEVTLYEGKENGVVQYGVEVATKDLEGSSARCKVYNDILGYVSTIDYGFFFFMDAFELLKAKLDLNPKVSLHDMARALLEQIYSSGQYSEDDLGGAPVDIGNPMLSGGEIRSPSSVSDEMTGSMRPRCQVRWSPIILLVRLNHTRSPTDQNRESFMPLHPHLRGLLWDPFFPSELKSFPTK